MAGRRTSAETIDAYIAAQRAEVRPVLQKIRQTVRRAAPGATECIGYAMPSFRLNGALVYFAAFKNHVGFFPPVRGDAKLTKAASIYAGPKGNLRFPLDEPIPYALITRLVKVRVKQDAVRRRRSR